MWIPISSWNFLNFSASRLKGLVLVYPELGLVETAIVFLFFEVSSVMSLVGVSKALVGEAAGVCFLEIVVEELLNWVGFGAVKSARLWLGRGCSNKELKIKKFYKRLALQVDF